MKNRVIKCFSHYPAKILSCVDDGGSLCVDNEDVYDYVRDARNHFKETNKGWGGTYRMGNIRAAWLNIRLRDIDRILARRKEIAERYLEELKDLPIGLPNNQIGRSWQDFIINVGDRREELFNFLKEKEVETIRNNYDFPAEYPKLPKAAKFEAETLRIPCNDSMLDEEVEEVIKKIKEFYAV